MTVVFRVIFRGAFYVVACGLHVALVLIIYGASDFAASVNDHCYSDNPLGE